MTDRKSQYIADLTQLAADMSGFPTTELTQSATFLSLGFDSLFLTQLATAYQKKFGAKITFRQLIETTPTIDALADHLCKVIPASMPTVAQAPSIEPQRIAGSFSPQMAPKPAAVPSGIADIFAAQLQLMREQIELLKGGDRREALPALVTQEPVASASSGALVNASDAPSVFTKSFGPRIGASDIALTPLQRMHIDRLTRRYTEKTAGSKALVQRDRDVHADPRTAAGFNSQWKELVYPIVVSKSFGAHLWDVDGNKYVDWLNGFGPNFFGHRAPFITEAIRQQLDDSFEVGPQTPLAGEAARLLCEMTGMDRVSWVNTGSEAVQAAIRISRTVTGRDKIVLFSGDYHGNFDEVLVRGVKSGLDPKTVPLAPGIPSESVSNVIVLDYGEDSSIDYINSHAEQIACVLIEPVQSRRPEFQPKEFLHKLRTLTREKGIVYVFDEVITGFRTCPGGAQEYYGIKADLATYGKIIGGGMPIGVVAGRSEFMDTFDGGFWQYGDESKPTAGVTFFAGTFVRHPMTIAAVHASLSYLKTAGPALQAGVNAKAKYLADALNRFFEERGVKIFVAQFASQMFVRVKEDTELATLFFYHMRDRGVHLLEGFPCYMTAAHTDEDVEHILRSAKESVLEMQADGILPTRTDVSPAIVDRDLPLTPVQQEIWATSQLGDDANLAYNESDSFSILGPLDSSRFIACAEEVLNTATALRHVFSDDGVTQRFVADQRISVNFVDLGRSGETEQSQGLNEILGRELNTPFDLIRGPLARATLVRLSQETHVFILFAHHIVFDGYSAALVIDDILRRYGAQPEANAIHPFKEYILSVASKPEVIAHWKASFGDHMPEALALPTLRGFPAVRDFRADSLHRVLPGTSWQNVVTVAKSMDVTPNVVLLSLYALLLSKICGQRSFVIGVPTAGQAATGIDAVGCCVSTLPIRIEVNHGITLAELIRDVSARMLEGSEYGGVSLMDVIAAVDVPRDPARPTLIQAVFNFSRMLRERSVSGLKVRAHENPRQALVYDLFANFTECEGALVLDWQFASAPFDGVLVATWIDGFHTLVENAVAALDHPVSDVGLMSLDQQEVIFQSLRGEKVASVGFATAIEAIADQVSNRPDSIAVKQGAECWTYRSLWERSGRIATSLSVRRVKPGDVVGLAMARTPDLIAAMLGVWRCGAAYLPIDLTHPESRNRRIIDNAAPAVIIVDETARPAFGGIPVALPLDECLQLEAMIGIGREVVPETPAYLLYTSGSTGVPKGVLNSHGPLMNFFEGLSALCVGGEFESMLAHTTLTFDISLIEVVYPLIGGRMVILATTDQAADGLALINLIDAERPDVMQGTPSTYRMLLESGWNPDGDLIALSGGEPLTPDLVSRLRPHVRELWNFYGPTEASVYVTCGMVQEGEIVSIGKPMLGTHLYVLDASGQPCPIGVTGEVYIGGRGVCDGYWQQPALTRERFVPDRFAADAGARMYCTGDLGRRRPDGELELLGRRDSQVKLRGFRIELGEIEAALQTHAAIEAAVCRVIGDAAADATLVAYFTVDAASDVPMASELRRHLRRTLPNYMVPQLFVDVQSMPLNPAGKVDRKALPLPDALAPERRETIEPRDETEKGIADVWRDLLGVTNISVTDNFFELGGQSLQAAQMVAYVRKRLGRRIQARDVIYETLEQLAARSEEIAA